MPAGIYMSQRYDMPDVKEKVDEATAELERLEKVKRKEK